MTPLTMPTVMASMMTQTDDDSSTDGGNTTNLLHDRRRNHCLGIIQPREANIRDITVPAYSRNISRDNDCPNPQWHQANADDDQIDTNSRHQRKLADARPDD